MSPYEGAPLTEDMIDEAIERLVDTMLKSSEEVRGGDLG